MLDPLVLDPPAAEACPIEEETPLGLYNHGRALAVTDPHAGLTVLERALRVAEHAGQPSCVAWTAQALARLRCDLGEYAAAIDWADWGLRIARREALDDPALRLELLVWRTFALALSGADATPFADEVCAQAPELPHVGVAETLLARGECEAALQVCQAAWDACSRREELGLIACVYVQVAVAAGQPQQALRIAEQAMELSRGLHRTQRRWGMLACGVACARLQPTRAMLLLRAALDDFRATQLAPRIAQTSLYLAHTLAASGDAAAARAALDEASDVLAGLAPSALAWLMPDARALAGVLALRTQTVAPLELRLLGRAEARLGGETINLRLRFAELLATLALHPEGLTLEQLALEVYGEDASLTLCKTEISRLRRTLPVESRPYRLGVTVRADFLDVRALLREGRLREALGLYQGCLLPRSDAPAINALREDLEVALREAVLASRDPEAVWLLAERLPDDLEVWEAAIERLARDDPRRFLAKARVARLEREWDEDDNDDDF